VTRTGDERLDKSIVLGFLVRSQNTWEICGAEIWRSHVENLRSIVGPASVQGALWLGYVHIARGKDFIVCNSSEGMFASAQKGFQW
jgi:hypothetical protein